MKNKFILMLFVTVLFNNAVVFAADTEEKSVSALTKRTNELEDQIILLKQQINQIQKENNKKSTKLKKQTNQIQKENNKNNKNNKENIKQDDDDSLQYKSLVEMYAHGPAVVTSPSLGSRRFDDNSSYLMVRLSTINEDLVLLGLRQKMDNYANKNGIDIPSRPIIALSGKVEAQFLFSNNTKYSKNSKGDINLSGSELDVIAEAGPWTTAAMIISYDSKAGPKGSETVARVNNSRVRLDRGWMTFGQLNKFPAYLTIGQVYAPFGSYSGYGVDKPSTRKLGRTKDRMVVLGYTQNGFSAQAYGLAGETKSTGSEFVKHTGIDLNYKYDSDNFMMIAGAGVLGSLAESQTLQDNIFSRPKLAGGAGKPEPELLNSCVSGINGRVKFTFYKAFNLLTEYVGASKAFNQNDLTFNGSGAKPQALNIEGGYNFRTMQRPSVVFAGYGLTRQALALDLPKHTFFAGYNISIIKDTLASIEYRHNINYNWGDIGGSGGRVPNVSVTGRHSNSVLAEIGVFF